MSSIPTKQIDGDVAVGRNVSMGGTGTVRGSLTVGHNLTVEGWLEAKNVKGPNKGLFKTAAQLREAYPNPQEGWWALVTVEGSAESDHLGQLYMADGGAWVAQVDSDGNALLKGNPTIDSTEYLEAVEQMTADLDAVKVDVSQNATGIKSLRSTQTTQSDSINNLNTLMTSETSAREKADEELKGVIETAKAEAEETASTALEGEETARKAADEALQGNIDAANNSVQSLEDAMERKADALQTNIDALAPTLVPTILLADADTYWGADGAAMKETLSAGTKATRVNVKDADGHLIGVMDVFADDSWHGITQVMLTRESATGLNNGVTEHSDEMAGMVMRSYGIALEGDMKQYNGKWSGWKKVRDTAMRDDITELTDNLSAVQEDVAELKKNSSPSAVLNLTAEYPVEGYYELYDDEDTAFSAVHVAWNAGKASLGLLMTFKVSKTKWKTYQYTGSSVTEAAFKTEGNWQDFGSMAEGSLNYIVIDNLCGAPTAGSYYTLESAVTRLVAYEQETNVSYVKPGLIIAYATAENTMETKQFQGASAADAAETGLWKDFGGGSDVETSDTPEEGGKEALSTGGAYANIPTTMKADTETEGVVKLQMLNAGGEAVGDEVQFAVGTGSGGGTGTVVTISPEQSPLYAKAAGTVTLKCAIRSVTTQGQTEQTNLIEKVEIYDRDTNQLLETLKLNQASSADAETYDFAFDLSTYFTQAGARKFKLVAYDDSENTGSRNINVTAVDVTITSEQTLNYTASTVLTVGGSTKTLPMYKFANNASEKGILCTTEICVDGEWQTLGTATISDTYTHSVSVNPNNCMGKVLSHGAYQLRIHGVDVASGVVGNYLYTTIMCIDKDLTTPIVATRYYSDEKEPTVQQYDTVSMDFAVYDPENSTSTAAVTVDGKQELTRACYRSTTYTYTKQIEGVATDGSYTMSVKVICGSAESATAKWTVSGSILDIEPVTTQLQLDMDFSNRSNADADKSMTDNGYTLTLTGANWSTNGFVKDTFGTSEYGSDADTGIMALRIAENVTGRLDYKMFDTTAMEANGAAIQFRIKVKNVADDDAKVMQCINTAGYGFYVTGTQVVMTTDGNATVAKSIASAFSEDTLVDVAIVIEPTSQAPYGGIGVMKMYFDGELVGACYYDSGTLTGHDTIITFDGTEADLYLYNIRAWETYYSFEQAFDNYLLKMSDTSSMITEYTFNQVMASQSAEGKPATNRPQASSLYDKGIPYFVVCKNADTDNTSDQYPDYLEGLDGDKKTKRILDIYAYFPDRPWQDFKAIGVTVTNQGTTSSQRPIKNIKMKLKAATLTLLHTADEYSGDELAKYNTCAKNAAKHKVKIYEDSLPTNIITVKVDYSESGGANNGASTQLYNELQWALGNDYITPAQRFNSDSHKINTSINSIPCSFCRTDANSADATSPSYGYFHAKGNWNEDKGDAKVFGFEGVSGYNADCLNYGDFYELVTAKDQTLADYLSKADKTQWLFEESTNSDGTVNYWQTVVVSDFCGPNYKVFRKQEDGTWKDTTGTMGFVDGAWTVEGDVVNPVENYELLKYDALDWMQGVNSVDDMLVEGSDGAPIWTQYYESRYPDDDNLNALYESGKKVPYKLYKWLRFCQDCNHHLTEADGNITLNGVTVAGTTANRLLKWRQELHTMANVKSVLAYHVFTDYVAAVDQRSKNMMVGFYLDTDGVTRMYLNHLYDGDTILGSDNDCGLTVPALLDPNEDTAYYQGWDSVLFQQIKNAGNEAFTLPDGSTVTTRQVAQAMRTTTVSSGLVPFSQAGLTKYWITDRLSKWPKLVSSYDGMRKYVEHSKSTANYFFALHGLSIQRLKAFIKERFVYRDGFYQTGDLYSSTLNMRISASKDVTIKIKAAKQGFFGLAVERVDTITDSCYLNEGEEYVLKANSHILGAGNMMYVLGANKLAEVDISAGTVSESGWSIGECTLLRKLVIGGEDYTPVTITAGELKNLNLGNMPFLEELDIRNTGVTSVNATYCPRLKTVKAKGSALTNIDVAETAPISTMELPATMTTLWLKNLPSLSYPGGLTIEGVQKVTKLYLDSCPNIDAMQMLETIAAASALKNIRIPDINTTSSADILRTLKGYGTTGIDESGAVSGESGQCSGLTGRWILKELLEDAELAELQAYYPKLEVINSQFSVVVFDDTVSDPKNITNLDNNTTGETYEASGHVTRIRRRLVPVKGKLNTETGVWEGERLSNGNYHNLADGTEFDYKDQTGASFDVMMRIPHLWYKGVNDFKNQKKYICWSSLDTEPLSTANNVNRKTLKDIIYAENVAVVVASAVVGESTLNTDGVLVTTANYNAYKIDVTGMKQVRWPGVNHSQIGGVFVDASGVIIAKYNMAVSNAMFDFAEGDYIFTDVPDGAVAFVFGAATKYNTLEAIAVDSAEIEAIEPDWVESAACLGGVYEASLDSLTQLRSISGGTVRMGDGTATTSTEWAYDSEGNPTNTPVGTLHYTCKDLMNLAARRGSGYQLFDYEMSKLMAILYYSMTGNRDAQLLCGYGRGAGGTTGYADTLGNTDSERGQVSGNKCLGFESFFGCTWEVMDNVGINIRSYAEWKKDKQADSNNNDPIDAKWHIYDPVTKTERVVQGITSSGVCIGRVKHGRYCDVIASKCTTDNSVWASDYTDVQYYSASRGRVVGRAHSSSSADGGLVYASASRASSYASAYCGARLAFRGKISVENDIA